MPAPKPIVKVTYNNVDISTSIEEHLLGFTFHDKEDGSADDLQIELENKDALWQNNWYPDKGAVITAQLGYQATGLVNVGKFTLDEIEYRGTPDVITLKNVSAYVTKKLKTKRTVAHANKTLQQIAQSIAANHGFKVTGIIDNITINYTMQHRKNDLQFLHTLAASYGYLFNVKGTQMIFTKIATLDSVAAQFAFDRSDLMRYSIRDKMNNSFAGVNLTYHNPVDHTTYHTELKKNLDGYEFPTIVKDLVDKKTVSDNILTLYDKAETEAQANAKALGQLYIKNRSVITGDFTIQGLPNAVAGNNFTLTGMGKLSGLWHITESIHTVRRGQGYTTQFLASKVGVPVGNQTAQKKSKKVTGNFVARNASSGKGDDGWPKAFDSTHISTIR